MTIKGIFSFGTNGWSYYDMDKKSNDYPYRPFAIIEGASFEKAENAKREYEIANK
jgi:hypothetical protein